VNPAPMPAVSALYAALMAMILIVLGLRVVALWRRHRVGIGDGGDRALQQAIRVHANAVEWGLPVLLLLLVADLNRANPVLLHVAGVALIVGRLMHAAGLSSSPGASAGRVGGMVLTIAALVALTVFDLTAFVRTLLV